MKNCLYQIQLYQIYYRHIDLSLWVELEITYTNYHYLANCKRILKNLEANAYSYQERVTSESYFYL